MRRLLLPAFGAVLVVPGPLVAQGRILDAGPRWLRMGDQAEWTADAAHLYEAALELRFQSAGNQAEQTLSLRQTGVKWDWEITLNERPIGRLYPDENAHRIHFAVPAGALRQGENVLRIAPLDSLHDDVQVADILLHPASIDDHLGAAGIEVTITTAEGVPTPARVTIVDAGGTLVQLATGSGGMLAVRPGVVYTADGRASLRLPAGEYVVYASRGFEYGVDSARVAVGAGEVRDLSLRIRREVPTEGWVASDTHVHTATHSGHGDATVEERVITLAGEGIELPILTDHNVHVDLNPTVQEMRLAGHFTPVAGNELTTPVGHFNLFPVPVTAAAPPHQLADWAAVKSAIDGVPGVQGIILNHPRDIHAGFRPFGEEDRVSPPEEREGKSGGVEADSWPLPANAMEIMNSGSQQNDPLELFHDWLQMMARGYQLTPVGSSDSHDVARYIPGQARTYIRVADTDPGHIDTPSAIRSFRAGAVMVSFGLLAELTVNGRYGPGDEVPRGEDELEVSVRVLGPSWTGADRVSLYVDGERVQSVALTESGVAGVKWSGSWRIPRPRAGASLVALAEGPDPRRPFWPVALPYQPSSPEVVPRVMGASGAIRVE